MTSASLFTNGKQGHDHTQRNHAADNNEQTPGWREAVQKVSKKGGVGGPVALASGYENTYPLPNRPE